jgi:hypothetical protein
MLRILHDTKIDFIKHWRTAVILTVAFVVLGLGSGVFTGWFSYSIEFTGGTLLQLEFKEAPDAARLRAAVDKAGIKGAEIQQFGSPTSYTIKAQDEASVAAQDAGAEGVSKTITDALTAELGAGSFEVADRMAVGPRVGERTPPRRDRRHPHLVPRDDGLPRHPLRVALRRRGRDRDGARHPRDARVHQAHRPRGLPHGHRGRSSPWSAIR